MRKITEIILHATATQPDFRADQSTSAKVAEVRRWHLARGWSDIGYHFLIDRDGTVATGRSMIRDGAHVKGRNTGTIGIALFGGHGSAETDRFSDHYTTAQDRALRLLIDKLRQDHGYVPVTGHNQYAAKACPGFIVAEWLAEKVTVQVSGNTSLGGEALAREISQLIDDPQPTDSADMGGDLASAVEKARWRFATIRDQTNESYTRAIAAGALAELPDPIQ